MWINKIIYFLLTVYAAVLSVLYYEVQALYIFVILLLLPLFFLVQVYLVKRKLYVALTSNSKIALAGGDGMQIRILVGNDSFLPATCVKIRILYENSFAEGKIKKDFMVSVGPKSQKYIDFTLKSSHTGLVKIKVEKIMVYDFIRVFSRTVKKEAEVMVSVLPEIYMIGSNITIHEPDFVESDVFSKKKPGDDPSEVFDIREYKPGDRINRIHWKLSSKKETILIKDYSLPVANSASIIINTSLPKEIVDKLKYLDALMGTVASISYELLSSGCHHYVAWYEQKEQNYISSNLVDLNDMYDMMNCLISITPTDEKNDVLEAHQVYGEPNKVSRVFYITNELTEEVVGLLIDSYGQAQIEVLLLGDKGPEENEEDSLGQRLHKQYIAISDCKTSIEALQM